MIGLGIHPTVAKLISHICTHEGALPQGSPTSPVLSNIICWSLDKALLKLAKDHRCFYTRYADDITFSTFQSRFPAPLAKMADIDGIPTLQVGADLSAAVADAGFSLNPNKTRLLTKADSQEVTGLIVNEKVNVRRSFVRNIRSALHKWAINGLDDATFEFSEKYARGKVGKKADLESHLRGKLAHLSKIKGDTDSTYVTLRDTFNSLAVKKIPVKENSNKSWMELISRSVWVIQTEGRCRKLVTAPPP